MIELNEHIADRFHEASLLLSTTALFSNTRRGPMTGRRVVRGREDACLELYRARGGPRDVDPAAA